MPFFDLIDKKKSKINIRKKFQAFNRFFKSQGLELGRVTLHRANPDHYLNDFEIEYIDEKKNLSKLCQIAK